MELETKMSRYHDDDPGDCTDKLDLDEMLSNMLDNEEYPQDDWFKSLDEDKESLKYKDEVVMKLIDALQEYLSFATTRDLLKLIVDQT